MRKFRPRGHHSRRCVFSAGALLMLVRALLAALSPLTAHGAIETWNPSGTRSGNGTWDAGVTPDWDSHAVWANGNDALFSGTGGTVTVVAPFADSLTFSATGPYLLTGGTLTLLGSDVTVNRDATIASAITATPNMAVTGTGTLTLTGNAGFNSDLTIDSGNVAVASGGALSNAGNYLDIGLSGSATLLMLRGGTVSNDIGYIAYNARSSGIVTVTGSGSTWTNSYEVSVGEAGAGTLVIANGGAVSTGYQGIIGDLTGSTGRATVTGSGSSWTNKGSFLYVGNSGNGTLLVSSGGAVSDFIGMVGYNAGSSGTVKVSGSGSTWTNTGNLFVGNSGTGTLAITNGGSVFTGDDNDNGVLGAQIGASGMATVSGTGSTWNDVSDLTLTGGLLRIANGGAVSDEAGSASGTMSVSGNRSQWTNSGDLYVGEQGTGTLLISSGGAVSDVNGWVGNGDSGGSVTVTGNGSIWANSGELYVGNGSTGMLAISSGGMFSSGSGSIIGDAAGSRGMATVAGSGSKWRNYGNSIIGEFGNGTLAISNGGSVFDAGQGVIGDEGGSSGVVTVSGTGSTWTGGPANFLIIGNYGSGTLVISNGGAAVNSAFVYLGDQAGSNGAVAVSGNGSKWTVLGAEFGESGTGALTVINGAAVSIEDGFMLGTLPGSTGRLTVSGSGSTLSPPRYGSAIEIDVGNSGTGTLAISNGGTVLFGGQYDEHDDLPDEIAQDPGSRGTVTVSGYGSKWTVGSDLYIGLSGTGALLITNGGSVSNANDEDSAGIGQNPGSSGVVTVSGSGSKWTNSLDLNIGVLGRGSLTLTDGALVSVTGTTTVGSDGTLRFDRSSVLDTGSLVIADGTLVTLGDTNFDESAALQSGNMYVDTDGFNSTFSGAFAGPGGIVKFGAGTLTLTGSSNLEANLEIAGSGGMRISGGGMVSDAGGIIGVGGADTMAVSGSGSEWTDAGGVSVAYSGTGTLAITNGGAVVTGSNAYIGLTAGSYGAATVSGSGSNWSIAHNLIIGDSGAGALAITAGAAVSDSDASIGFEASSTGRATVSGSGASWKSEGNLVIGGSGAGTLAITGGGALSDETSYFGSDYMGFAAGSIGRATVAGAGSVWSGGGLYVGDSGMGFLLITNGGEVFREREALGENAGSSGTVMVTGSGSISTNAELDVGEFGQGTLAIANGGRTITIYSGVIGDHAGSSGVVIVSGSGSTWTIGNLPPSAPPSVIVTLNGGSSGDMYIGKSGAGKLWITAGGVVSDAGGWLGFSAGSWGTATVSGSGSTWSNGGQLSVGETGTGDLLIANGGSVSSIGVVAGDSRGAVGVIAVSGTGSLLSSSVTVGEFGTGTLAIGDGGAVVGEGGIIGYRVGSVGTVTVSGGGSWSNMGALAIGQSGTGVLVISSGGTVFGNGYGGYIGNLAGSSGIVTVTGSGSAWVNSGNLFVGGQGAGALVITAGGSVLSGGYDGDTIGDLAGSSGRVTVSGSGSKWTIANNLAVGRSGTGTLVLKNGGSLDVAGAITIGSAGALEFDGASSWIASSIAISGGAIVTLGSVTSGAAATLGVGGVKINSDGFNSTFSGSFSGTGGITKFGAGAVTLTGSSAYTGATRVNAGTLALTTGASDTTSLADTAIQVASGATFSASVTAASFSKAVNAGALGSGTAGATLTLNPGSAFSMAGNSIASFNLRQENSFSGFAFTIGGASGLSPALTFDIGNGATGTDRINVTSTVRVLATGGEITIDALAGDTSLAAGSYDLITSAGGFSGTDGNGLELSGTTLAVDGSMYDLSLAQSTTDDEVLTVSAAPATPRALERLAAVGNLSSEDRLAGSPAPQFSFGGSPLVATAAVPEPSATMNLISAFAIATCWHLRHRRRGLESAGS